MARRQIGNPPGLAIPHTAHGHQSDSVPGTPGTSWADLESIDGMKTALQTDNPTRYTDARLAAMTMNDLVYAMRVEGLVFSSYSLNH